MALQKECDSLKSRARELDSYMAGLPTQDEVAFTNKRADKLVSENTDMQNRLQETEKKVMKAKYYIKEKVQFYFNRQMPIFIRRLFSWKKFKT